MKTAKEFALTGYTVRPAVNGGFLVTDDTHGSYGMAYLAAFTSADDLLAWLTEGHQSVAFDMAQQKAQVQA